MSYHQPHMSDPEIFAYTSPFRKLVSLYASGKHHLVVVHGCTYPRQTMQEAGILMTYTKGTLVQRQGWGSWLQGSTIREIYQRASVPGFKVISRGVLDSQLRARTWSVWAQRAHRHTFANTNTRFASKERLPSAMPPRQEDQRFQLATCYTIASQSPMFDCPEVDVEE